MLQPALKQVQTQPDGSGLILAYFGSLRLYDITMTKIKRFESENCIYMYIGT